VLITKPRSFFCGSSFSQATNARSRRTTGNILFIIIQIYSKCRNFIRKPINYNHKKLCGITDYDEFKNSSFNLLHELLKTDDNYAKIKTDINGYAEGTRDVTVANVKASTSNTKKSIQAVDYSKSMMSEITSQVTQDMEMLSEKLAEI